MQKASLGAGDNFDLDQGSLIIDATPSEHLTFLVKKTGRPYGESEFSGQFRAWTDEARLPTRCSFHGLRKALCRRLAEAGCSASEIAAWSGHATLTEVARYTRAALGADCERKCQTRAG